MAVYQLNNELWFPDPYEGESDGLVAIGGDLSVMRLILAYSNGFFPWYSFKDYKEPSWYCPLDRYVIFPDEIHVSHSMKQLIRQNRYEVTINQDFDGVINGCSTVDGRFLEDGAWLGPNIIEAYTKLHKLGFAFSVEVWDNI
jgi:leucyl/phenylalanyl-tRNA--protein transferase